MLNRSDLFKLGVFWKVQNKLSFKVFNKKCVGALYREIFNTQVGVIINLLNKSLKKINQKIYENIFFWNFVFPNSNERPIWER